MSPTGRFQVAVVVTTILLQRISVPMAGGVPLVLPVGVLLLAWGVWQGALVLDRRGALLYAAGIGAATVAAALGLVTGLNPSVTSWVMLVVLYLIVLVRPADQEPADRDKALSRFVDLMIVAGVVGLAQAGLQEAGVPYRDWLGELLPQQMLVPGFNTGDPLYWGSTIIRSNAVVFLEPSILSMCLGLAAVVAASLRRSVWVIALLLVAILPTVALTGLVIVAAAVLQGLLQGRDRVTGRLAAPMVVMLALGAMVPNGARLMERTTEIQTSGTSGNARVVAPYEVLLPGWVQDLHGFLTGYGPGTSTAAVEASAVPSLVTATIPKALYEYGVIGGVILLAVLVLAMWRGGVGHPWGLGLMVVFFVVNASLLVPVEVFITFMFLTVIPSGSPPRTPHRVEEQPSLARST